MAEHAGPFENERQAHAAAVAAIPPEPGWSILSQGQRSELLRRALAGGGVQTTPFEDSTAWWLCNWEDYVCAVIARWIASAYEAGKQAAGTSVEWGVAVGDVDVIADLAASVCADESEARRAVGALRVRRPELGWVVVKRLQGVLPGPWMRVPELEAAVGPEEEGPGERGGQEDDADRGGDVGRVHPDSRPAGRPGGDRGDSPDGTVREEDDLG